MARRRQRALADRDVREALLRSLMANVPGAIYRSAWHADCASSRPPTRRASVPVDGVGGATPGAGTGLRGLADRVGALDGRITVRRPPGEGTLLRAVIPVGGR